MIYLAFLSIVINSIKLEMDRLFDSMKISRGQTKAGFYIFTLIIVVFVILLSILAWTQYKNVTLANIQTTYPNIPITRVLYVITAIIFLWILFILFNSQFEVYFQRRQSSGIDRLLPSSKVFWTPASSMNPQDPHDLTLVSDDFPMSGPETYSLGVELMISDTRTNDKFGPFRHLLQRGTEDLSKFTPNTPGSDRKGSGGLNDGLPTQMNPGLFVDQFSNDLIIFVDTDPVGEGRQAYRESVRISDAPLNKAFYIHITVHDRLLEVYMNCRLAATKLLHGQPRGVPNDWFGRIGFSRARGIIQNLTLWDSNLYAIEIRKMCPGFTLPANLAPTSAPVCGRN